jgi:ABC-type transport system involved in multi-copper enzyme maturation permease subunit
MGLGVSRIEYRPWKRDRTDPKWRFLVISRYVFRKNIKATSVIVILILGILLAHVFPIIGAVLFPHENISDSDMIGQRGRFDPGAEAEYDFNVTEGNLTFDGDVLIDGNFTLKGTMMFEGKITLQGTIIGFGTLAGFEGATTQSGLINVTGIILVRGSLTIGNLIIAKDPGDDLENITDGFPEDPFDLLSNIGVLTGNGTISGRGSMSGNGSVEGVYTPEEEEIDFTGGAGYLTGFLFLVFAMLLAAIICSDIISNDLADSSFVLYFSRPVKPFDYLVGKLIGLSWVMGIFCFLLPLIYVLVMIGTQSGNDWGNGARIFGLTFVAGIVTSLFFLPYGLMLSSFTKRKAYAGIGIFMSFFVLSIIAGIFGENSDKWSLIDPIQVLSNFNVFLFGANTGTDISGPEVATSLLAFTIVPMVIVYYWIQRKGVGR